MKAFLKTIKEYITNNAIGLQSTLFLTTSLKTFKLLKKINFPDDI